jgi:hypothetical protein
LNWLVRLNVLTSQIGVEFLFAAKPFYTFSRLARIERARRQRVRNPHVKGQTALQLDLPVKQMHRLGNFAPQLNPLYKPYFRVSTRNWDWK